MTPEEKSALVALKECIQKHQTLLTNVEGWLRGGLVETSMKAIREAKEDGNVGWHRAYAALCEIKLN